MKKNHKNKKKHVGTFIPVMHIIARGALAKNTLVTVRGARH